MVFATYCVCVHVGSVDSSYSTLNGQSFRKLTEDWYSSSRCRVVKSVENEVTLVNHSILNKNGSKKNFRNIVKQINSRFDLHNLG